MDSTSQMSNGEVTVPASSFKQRTDMNIAPSLVNVTLGSAPQHWLSTNPISRFDLKRGANPRSHKIMRFEEFMDGVYEPENK